MSKYSDYIGIFSFGLIIKFSKNIDIDEYIIKLVEDKHPLYRSIYTLSLEKLEILKPYIKTYLKLEIFWSSKSFICALILFEKKPDISLSLYVVIKASIIFLSRIGSHYIWSTRSWIG